MIVLILCILFFTSKLINYLIKNYFSAPPIYSCNFDILTYSCHFTNFILCTFLKLFIKCLIILVLWWRSLSLLYTNIRLESIVEVICVVKFIVLLHRVVTLRSSVYFYQLSKQSDLLSFVHLYIWANILLFVSVDSS